MCTFYQYNSYKVAQHTNNIYIRVGWRLLTLSTTNYKYNYQEYNINTNLGRISCTVGMYGCLTLVGGILLSLYIYIYVLYKMCGLSMLQSH